MSDLMLRVIGPMELIDSNDVVEFSPNEQRLLGYLSMVGQRVDRMILATALWPDVADERARNNLRSALWRINALGRPLIEADPGDVRLSASLEVDLRTFRRRSLAAVRNAHVDDSLGTDQALLHDLCEGVHDSWISCWRERWRQLRLHVLVLYLTDLRTQGRIDEAARLAEQAQLSAPNHDSLRLLGSRCLDDAPNMSHPRSRSDPRAGRLHRQTDRPIGTAIPSHLKEPSK